MRGGDGEKGQGAHAFPLRGAPCLTRPGVSCGVPTLPSGRRGTWWADGERWQQNRKRESPHTRHGHGHIQCRPREVDGHKPRKHPCIAPPPPSIAAGWPSTKRCCDRVRLKNLGFRLGDFLRVVLVRRCWCGVGVPSCDGTMGLGGARPAAPKKACADTPTSRTPSLFRLCTAVATFSCGKKWVFVDQTHEMEAQKKAPRAKEESSKLHDDVMGPSFLLPSILNSCATLTSTHTTHHDNREGWRTTTTSPAGNATVPSSAIPSPPPLPHNPLSPPPKPPCGPLPRAAAAAAHNNPQACRPRAPPPSSWSRG